MQQRILESNCRLCGRTGHWKSECPMRSQTASSSTSASAPVTLSVGALASMDEVMPLEFMKLPEVDPPPTQDIRSATSICCVQSVFSNSGQYKHVEKAHSENMRVTRERIRSYVQGNMDSHNPKVTSLVTGLSLACVHPPLTAVPSPVNLREHPSHRFHSKGTQTKFQAKYPWHKVPMLISLRWTVPKPSSQHMILGE